jgi:small ligand-binding sensory domain FIST
MSTLRPVPTALARVGVGANSNWEHALREAVDDLAGFAPDLVLLFCGSAFVTDMPEMAVALWQAFRAPIVVGASGQGVIARQREYEHDTAVAIMGLSLPGAVLSPIHLTHRSLEGAIDVGGFHRRLGVLPGDVNGWIMFANPFRVDAQNAIATLAMAYPGVPIAGGVAAPDLGSRQTALLVNGEAIFDGAVVLGIGGPFDLLPVVSHGCAPIGQPWTITSVDGDWIETIAGRPALELLEETLIAGPADQIDRVRRNLFVGLATHEYQAEFQRGDFLIRTIAGVDQPTGAIAIGARARVGQTIQFQVRDAATADLDLGYALDSLRQRANGSAPIALLAFAGQERGSAFFGSPHHDSLAIQRTFPGIPAAGLFTAGEIGPAGQAAAVNAQSLTMALIAQRPELDAHGNRRYS